MKPNPQCVSTLLALFASLRSHCWASVACINTKAVIGGTYSGAIPLPISGLANSEMFMLIGLIGFCVGAIWLARQMNNAKSTSSSSSTNSSSFWGSSAPSDGGGDDL